MNDDDRLLDGCGLGLFFRWSGGEPGGYRRVGLDDFLFQPLGADLIERAGGDLGGGNAHFLGLRENFFVLEAKFLRNVVNTNGHKLFLLPPAGMEA